ncbi:NADH:ubiquinone oxidoreductase [Vibrio genomosp. F10]|uniref:NADH:ubiquinone oxidoreductase n=1 Tax=Vibrio genomosp. F10 TaxID=723171 RepID=A0A1B9QZC5_9VIBR|nr:NADH:ubiquinone oxidoreductase [Vibrio genomosp. F10]OCH75886.1 NADH:ubiquinone oxidoreductase [Vibrio genomosp. F10]
MKLIIIVMISIFAGVASAEHFHSFVLGLTISTLAVGSCYWFAFRTTRFPELVLLLLFLGMFAKLMVTVVGIVLSVSAELITSPMIFAMSYLFFSMVATYLWFNYRMKKTPHWTTLISRYANAN